MKINHKNKQFTNLLTKNFNFSRVYVGGQRKKLYYKNFKFLKGFKNNTCIHNLVESELYLKKTFKVIHDFNFYNKKILFINFPYTKFSQLIKLTNHYSMLSSSIDFNVFIHKKNTINKLYSKVVKSKTHAEKFKNLKILNEILRLTVKPNLLIIYDKSNVSYCSLKELLSLNIPVIFLFDSTIRVNTRILYKIPGNFKNLMFHNFYYYLLKSILTNKHLKFKMIQKFRSRYSSVYKKYIKFKIYYLNHTKLYKFRKLKWKKFVKHLKNNSRNKNYDLTTYNKTKYSFYYKNRYKINLQRKQRFKFYYGNLSKSFLKKKVIKSINSFYISNNKQQKLNNACINLFLIEYLESQLYMVIFRTFLSTSVRSVKQFIYQGNVFVNGCLVISVSYNLKIGDSISFKKHTHKKIQYLLMGNLINKQIITFPTFLKINFSTLEIYLIKHIKHSKLANFYPFLLETRYLIKHRNI